MDDSLFIRINRITIFTSPCRQVAKSNSLTTLIHKAIRATISSSRPSFKHHLVEKGVGQWLSSASDEVVDHIYHAGELAIQMGFLNHMFQTVASERTCGHFGTLKAQLLSIETYALMMVHSDVDIVGEASDAVAADAFIILAGLIFRMLEFREFQRWFAAAFGPVIAAADSAYLKYHAAQPMESGLHDFPGALPKAKRAKFNDGGHKYFSKARAILRIPEPPSAPATHSISIPTPQSAPHTVIEVPLTPAPGRRFLSGTLIISGPRFPSVTHIISGPRFSSGTLIISGISAFAKPERDAFVATALPETSLSVASTIQTGLSSGFGTIQFPETIETTEEERSTAHVAAALVSPVFPMSPLITPPPPPSPMLPTQRRPPYQSSMPLVSTNRPSTKRIATRAPQTTPVLPQPHQATRRASLPMIDPSLRSWFPEPRAISTVNSSQSGITLINQKNPKALPALPLRDASVFSAPLPFSGGPMRPV
ncbi:hypothetical protein B0H17DRAFT_1337460 [Mycena rosella]|uniref:Uncharacterized protein n=1 Tax=Mycena rosella TaxID=1033263 RepID=A0AAD7CUJ8_MYCRO|nr:hypothetical protein B0H17DRAFT_1337460 [Mycena rosella]